MPDGKMVLELDMEITQFLNFSMTAMNALVQGNPEGVRHAVWVFETQLIKKPHLVAKINEFQKVFEDNTKVAFPNAKRGPLAGTDGSCDHCDCEEGDCCFCGRPR